MVEAVNLALIGCGYWGKNYISTIGGTEDVNLRNVCDLNRGNLERFEGKKALKGTKFITDFQEIWKDSEIEGVIVATPASTHFEIARRVLEKGFDVLVEKPLTTNVKDAEELCEIAEEKHRVLMTGEIFRFNPALEWIRENVVFGDIKYIEARRVGLGPIRQDVGVLEDLATHDIYISNWFIDRLPEKVNCSGISHNSRVKDIVSLNLDYGNCLTSIYANWEHPIKERKIIIGGENKAVLFDDVEPVDKVRVYERGVSYQPSEVGLGSFIASTRDGAITIPKIRITQPLEQEIGCFIECIRNRNYGYNLFGLETVMVLEAAKKSMQNGGVEVRVE